MAAIRFDKVTKIHPLRKEGANSLKSLALGLFRAREEKKIIRAADEIDLVVEKGTTLGVIGPNGAGKTTMLKLIAGISEPTYGRVQTEGRILPLLELGAGFHPELSGYENIFLQGVLFGLKRKRIEEVLPDIIAFAEIENFIHMPVKHYSSGMYVRLGFAISVHVDPDILLIDELFSVGDIYFQHKCLHKMEELKKQGKTLVLVTHDIKLTQQVCDKVIWLEEGKIISEGTPNEIAFAYGKYMFDLSYREPQRITDSKSFSALSRGRLGNGGATLQYLKMTDSQGNISDQFEHGDSMQFRLRYDVHQPLKEIFCFIYVRSEHGFGIAAAESRLLNCPVIPNQSGRGEVRFNVEALQFAPGNYEMVTTLMIDQPDGIEAIGDLHMYTYSFRILHREGLNGRVAIETDSQWVHKPARSA